MYYCYNNRLMFVWRVYSYCSLHSMNNVAFVVYSRWVMSQWIMDKMSFVGNPYLYTSLTLVGVAVYGPPLFQRGHPSFWRRADLRGGAAAGYWGCRAWSLRLRRWAGRARGSRAYLRARRCARCPSFRSQRSNSVRAGFRGGGCYARAGRLGPERWEAPRRCDCAALLAWPWDGLGWRHTCAPSYTPAASSAARAVAEEAEAQKLRKYESLSDRVDFRAVGLGTLGAFGAGARALLDNIAARIDAHSGVINSRSTDSTAGSPSRYR